MTLGLTNSFKLPHDPCTLRDGKPCPACTDAAEVENQIAEAEKALTALISKRFSTRSQINHFHSSIIHKIPPEIISNIFIHYLPTTQICDRPVNAQHPQKGFSPLILGAVCKLWRTIAWSTPQLWGSVSLDLNRPRISTIAQIAKGWLVRSGRMPLSIRLSCKTPSTATSLYKIIDNEDVRSLIADISRCSSRWHDLDLSIPPKLMSCIRSTSGAVSSLENLFLDFNAALEELDGSKFDLAQVNLNINYSNLTHVNLLSLNVRDCLQIIRRAPQMTHCKLYDVHKVENVPSSVEHARLRSLSLGRRSYLGNYSSDFILGLIIPSSLEELIYQTSRRMDSMASLASLATLLSHSSHTLKLLTLKGIRTTFWDPDYLSQLGCLTYLRLETDKYAGSQLPGGLNELFDELSSLARYRSQTFLPHLEVLEIVTLPNQFTWSRVCAIFDSQNSTPTISSFANPRMGQGQLKLPPMHIQRPFRRLSIEVYTYLAPHEYIDIDHLNILRSLIENGFDIEFFSSNSSGDVVDLLSVSAARCEHGFDLDDI